tara:strand:+ start:252 stop:353 length:102 start_codon:yes stop_codon:yes gene_type:complete
MLEEREPQKHKNLLLGGKNLILMIGIVIFKEKA